LDIFKGASAFGTPIADKAGNLYGTTYEGGNGLCQDYALTWGCGVVYKLSPPATGALWTETLLYQFQGKDDGYEPIGSLIFDTSGNLYGVTYSGGAANAGTVFELTPPASGSGPWTKTTLYNFPTGAPGGNPMAGLIFDAAGNLYGTTNSGGSCNLDYGCYGLVYELSPPASRDASWTESVLYTFQGSTDGANPRSALNYDGTNLYGTTEAGGLTANCEGGCGVAFELSPPAAPGGAWTETVLYAFLGGKTDGESEPAGMTRTSSGTFYGVSTFGGAADGGTVYQLAPPTSPGGSWTETVYFFSGGSGGFGPNSTIAVGTDGSLYGTTTYGGGQEYGSVFKVAPPSSPGGPWVETDLAVFTRPEYPASGLTFGKGGWLYGGTLGTEQSNLCATKNDGGAQLPYCGELYRVQP
jgi:uncharacterized repeat protein (TIGR03803 family)